MQFDRESDVTDLLWHVVADSPPAIGGAFDAIDAAMILLPKHVWREWVLTNAMGIVPIIAIGYRIEIRFDITVERSPLASRVNALENSAARNAVAVDCGTSIKFSESAMPASPMRTPCFLSVKILDGLTEPCANCSE